MGRKFIMAVALAFVSLNLFAQQSDVVNYINQYKDIAINEMIRTGVPASITLAQGILESASGKSDLSISSNNHFGIKCKTEWTGDKIYHDDDEKGECFRVYPSVLDSYRDHSDFLKNRPYYASLFQIDPIDYKSWAYGLKKAGYATSRIYPQQLIKLIEDYNLQQYSLQASDMIKKGITAKTITPATTPVEETAIAKNSTPVFAESTSITDKSGPSDESVEATKTTVTIPAKVEPKVEKEEIIASAEPEKKSAKYPYNAVFKINNTKVVYVESGTSLFALANQYNINFSTLQSYNELSETTDILPEASLVYLEKKAKKGAVPFYIVSKGETVEQIAQTTGVQLASILNFNHISQGREPIAGQKLYLQSM